MRREDIRFMCVRFRLGQISEDYFWYNLTKYVMMERESIFEIAEIIEKGLPREGGDGS